MSGSEPVRFFLPVQSYRRMSMFDSPAHVGLLRGSVDFLCPEGTKVFAAAPGRVIDVKDDSDQGGDEQAAEGWGNFVEIQHADGSISEYEHLQKGSACVKIGDDVLPSNQIARSGATGWLGGLGPHLHFMVGRYTSSMVFEAQEIQWAIEIPYGFSSSPTTADDPNGEMMETPSGAFVSQGYLRSLFPEKFRTNAARRPVPPVPTERPTLTEAWVDSVCIAGLRKALELRDASGEVMPRPRWKSKEVGNILSLLRSIRVSNLQNNSAWAREIDERLPGWEFQQREVELAEMREKPSYDSRELIRIPAKKLDADA